MLYWRPLAVLVAQIDGAALNASNYYQYQVEEDHGEPQIVNILVRDRDIMRAWGTNLTAITWAHAVNSQQLLDEALTGRRCFPNP